MKLKFLLLFLSLTACEGGRIRLLGDGPVERCDKKPVEDLVMWLDIEFLVENDDAFVNGNATFNVDVDVWKANFWTERKIGAKWYRAPIQGSNVDICRSLVDERSFLHPFLKGPHPCPYKKGVCSISIQHSCKLKSLNLIPGSDGIQHA